MEQENTTEELIVFCVSCLDQSLCVSEAGGCTEVEIELKRMMHITHAAAYVPKVTQRLTFAGELQSKIIFNNAVERQTASAD